jgi:hypothetical protein
MPDGVVGGPDPGWDCIDLQINVRRGLSRSIWGIHVHIVVNIIGIGVEVSGAGGRSRADQGRKPRLLAGCHGCSSGGRSLAVHLLRAADRRAGAFGGDPRQGEVDTGEGGAGLALPEAICVRYCVGGVWPGCRFISRLFPVRARDAWGGWGPRSVDLDPIAEISQHTYGRGMG